MMDFQENTFKPSSFMHPDNAQKIIENNIAGLNRIVALRVVIDGREIVDHFLSFKLSQSTRKHHEFEVILPRDAFELVQNHQLEETQQFLGKKISVFIRYRDTLGKSPERVFVGVITKVAFCQEKGNIGNVVLKGKSPTVLLDGAPHTQSFGGGLAVNTGIIAEDILHQGLPKFMTFG